MSDLATAENLKSLAALVSASRNAKTHAEKMAVWDKHLTDIIKRIAPDMAQNKLTTAIATDMVNRLEALKAKYDADVQAIYAEADAYNGKNNRNVIIDALKYRVERREAEYNAAAMLESFDAEEDQ